MRETNQKRDYYDFVKTCITVIIETILAFILGKVLENHKAAVIMCWITINIASIFIVYHFMHKKIKRITDENAEYISNLQYKIDNMRNVGIIDCIEKLKESEMAPDKCMDKYFKNLDFMGIAGSKWVRSKELKLQFEKMLQKIDAQSGEVRFLLINPKGYGYEKLYDLRDGNISTNHYKFYQLMADKYKCFKVKLYRELPNFRLQFIDNKLALVGRYQIETKDYEKSNQGWDAPHVVLDGEPFWSLEYDFNRYFEDIWEKGEAL